MYELIQMYVSFMERWVDDMVINYSDQEVIKGQKSILFIFTIRGIYRINKHFILWTIKWDITIRRKKYCKKIKEWLYGKSTKYDN